MVREGECLTQNPSVPHASRHQTSLRLSVMWRLLGANPPLLGRMQMPGRSQEQEQQRGFLFHCFGSILRISAVKNSKLKSEDFLKLWSIFIVMQN